MPPSLIQYTSGRKQLQGVMRNRKRKQDVLAKIKNTIKRAKCPPSGFLRLQHSLSKTDSMLLKRLVIKVPVLWFDVAFSTLLLFKAIILPYNLSL